MLLLLYQNLDFNLKVDYQTMIAFSTLHIRPTIALSVLPIALSLNCTMRMTFTCCNKVFKYVLIKGKITSY